LSSAIRTSDGVVTGMRMIGMIKTGMIKTGMGFGFGFVNVCGKAG
jgi:hypothetical protein